ncbi:hypothetical protein PIB30_018223 [Stylosanthes scabra]|uniref:Uncharacterized protein n=1 Tax=Stylosanthes scabra TaxID=79078 RepID=A0ABU6U6U6_9FABA|nr:hypothetical protein [Stylosanthes scabra]
MEKEKEEAETAKSKEENDLEATLADAKEKGIEQQRLRDREAEASLASTEQARQELVKLAEDSAKATEDALKEQILVLALDFDVFLLEAWKEVVDGHIVDPPPEP